MSLISCLFCCLRKCMEIIIVMTFNYNVLCLNHLFTQKRGQVGEIIAFSKIQALIFFTYEGRCSLSEKKIDFLNIMIFQNPSRLFLGIPKRNLIPVKGSSVSVFSSTRTGRSWVESVFNRVDGTSDKRRASTPLSLPLLIIPLPFWFA